MRRSPTINIAHYKWKILNFFLFLITTPPPASPKTGQKKKPTCKRDGNQYQMSNETSSHKLYQ